MHQRVSEATLLIFLFVAGFLALAILSYSPLDAGPFYTGSGVEVANLAGPAGAWLAQLFISSLGVMAYLAPLAPILAGIYLYSFLHKGELPQWLDISWRTVGLLIVFLNACMLAVIHFKSGALPEGSGGIVGQYFSAYIVGLLGVFGGTFLLLSATMIGLSLATAISWFDFFEQVGSVIFFLARKVKELSLRLFAAVKKRRAAVQSANRTVAVVSRRLPNNAALKSDKLKDTSLSVQGVALSGEKPSLAARAKKKVQSMPTSDSSKAKEVAAKKQKKLQEEAMPSLTLLDDAPSKDPSSNTHQAFEDLSLLLEKKLLDFGIEAKVTGVYPGPVVTRLEVQPAAGVKAARISSLTKDLARSLAVISVRVVEVIPGKTVIGIEIPNEIREVVSLSETLCSTAYTQSKSYLTLALGKDIAGHVVCVDLQRMPHLLVAGATGSGKSVGVNAMLLSLLFKAGPEDVRLILIDPKVLELSVYEGIPHLLTPVITDMKEAFNALKWCVYEMDRRYRVMAAVGVRHLEGFNEKITKAREKGEPLLDPLPQKADQNPGEPLPELQPLPLIVVVIDEFADMIMVAGKKTEELIVRIAQKARAAGIHLILATQRPSVDVITGLIKANIPGRLSFRVSSTVDSRTILDQGGAEQLLGHGDMLFVPPGTALPIRVHGAFVGDDEVHRVAESWRNKASPNYLSEVLSGQAGERLFAQTEANEEGDQLYDAAVTHVIESRRASISSLQRKLRIGYNRAARLIDVMEEAGVVSPMDNAGNREVLVAAGS